MNSVVKLDLHTHPFEAMGSIRPTIESVGAIVKVVKARELDGIAVTEHHSIEYGFKAMAIASRHFKEVTIIPGCEINIQGSGSPLRRQVIELLIDGKIFRFQAHPVEERREILTSCHGIEVQNSLHPDLNLRLTESLAKRYELLPLTNSDAHRLEDIGTYFNEITLDELARYSEKPKPRPKGY